MTDWVGVVPTDDPEAEFEWPVPAIAAGVDAPPGVWPAAGIEVSADRARTWVCRAAQRKGRVHLELLPPLPGPASGLVVSTVAGWRAGWQTARVGIDPRSPSATLVDQLQAVRVPVKLADAHGMAVAHGGFSDLLSGGGLRIRGHHGLGSAIRQAQERRVAGAAGVDRYRGVDPAPLVAAELCCWVLLTASGYPPPDVF